MNWQPIETAPRDGSNYLTFGECGYVICHWMEANYFHDGAEARIFPGVSPIYWMPLPTPPIDHQEMLEKGKMGC